MTDDSAITAAFINSAALGRFEFSPEHPFKPERVTRVRALCSERGLFSDPGVRVVDVEESEDGVLERFHTPGYIEMLRKADDGVTFNLDMLGHGLGTAENPVFKGIYEFCALSATASLEAARLVIGGTRSAFNPCGGFHHAHPDRASGFCYVNDAAIAIKELQNAGKRVAYVDIDAHHGDGVQEAFFGDKSVLTISMHESGKTLFPWGGFEKETGEGEGKGYNINIPLGPETDDEIFLHLFNGIVMEALEAFSPDVIVGIFGADTLSTDPLTHLRLTNNGFIEAVQVLNKNHPRIVALGGGGYNMENVARCWTLLWSELSGIALDDGYGGAMGGVFLGDASVQGSDLRDMRLYTTGPEKERLFRSAETLITGFRTGILPLIG